MELTPKELMKQYVDSQKFTNTTENYAGMKKYRILKLKYLLN